MKLTVLASILPLTSAHYFFPHLFLNDVRSREFEYIRRSTQGFQPHFGPDILSSPDMRCNTGSLPNAPTTKTAVVKAGDTIGFGTNLAVNIQHPGPVMAYMSKAPGNVTQYDGSGDWFKIFELGATFPMNPKGDNWLVWDRNRIDVKIPKEVEAGEYLVRIEHVALHRPSGTELYFNCAHVRVENPATALVPRDTVKIPGVYRADDPGMKFSIYSPGGATSYPFPGPKVFPAGDESSAAPNTPAPSAPPEVPSPAATKPATVISSSAPEIPSSVATTLATVVSSASRRPIPTFPPRPAGSGVPMPPFPVPTFPGRPVGNGRPAFPTKRPSCGGKRRIGRPQETPSA